MGIPKFFRYVSERYPLTSQLIEENKIPEFDNLYLDFNGIIHNCSHPNDEDAHFRLSEEQIFTSIFAYVEHLFAIVKPKKLFFMAVDGVAPRAKMNQQRGRRFRAAKEAKELREKALRKGEKLPDEKAFDSNCITPGTPFMARLSEQLKYFVNKKITEDANWREIQVVLSGHEVPGEGEHKIMEYIRLSRAQSNYNPNVRHCLYGLDADLIMLGLLSHDPHFCLLREEVKFGPSRKKSSGSLESINFFLLHLCLMREYLDLEFRDIEPVLPFQYSLERVIDDFILLAVFVGNDFLPNLPDLHIQSNGLERLFDVYKKVLPSLDGYINESGTINTVRLQVVLNEMGEWEQEVFVKEYSDSNWYKGKQAKHVKEMEVASMRNKLVLTSSQRAILDRVREFVLSNRNGSASTQRAARLAMPNTFPAGDRKFIVDLADALHLRLAWDEYDDEDQNLVTWRLPGSGISEPLPEAKSNRDDGGEEGEWEDISDGGGDDDESTEAIDRVLKKYEKATVAKDGEDDNFDARHERSVQEKMNEWRRAYYKDKLEISFDDPNEMNALTYRYVEGLQWVMHYYYSGVASWGWFYDYHYAPRISDLRNVDKMSFNFELGKPFHPYEQLMGVLPVASKEHIPLAYQDLMFDVNSPILDFYPLEFEQDLNGKKQEWEAIVKIPFIDETRLLKAMASREHRLTPEEKRRNGFGTSTKFRYSEDNLTTYPSSLPGFFPPLYRCACIMEPFDLPTLNGLHLVPGLCDGVFLGKAALAGFPSLYTLPHTATLGHHGVNVHGSESRNKSMVIHITNSHEEEKVQDVARQMIGERVFVGWPFLQEGKVVSVSDSLFKYEKMSVVPGSEPKVVSNPHPPYGLGHWKGKAERIESLYSKKLGVVTGAVDVLLHIRPLKGLRREESGAFVKDYEGQEKEVEHALQMSLSEVVSEDPRFLEREPPPLSEEFPDGSKVFFLGEHAYGVAAQVQSTTDDSLSVVLAFFPSDKTENDQFKSIVNSRVSSRYFPAFKVAPMIGVSGRALSKITSSFMVVSNDNKKHNLGLSLKFEAKSLKVIGYSRKDGRSWEFSDKAVELIKAYKAKFPEIFARLDDFGDAMTEVYDIWAGSDSDAQLREAKAWLKEQGVTDLEPVTLFSDQLDKATVHEIEHVADSFTENKSQAAIKKAIVKGIPRRAVLKPAHAKYRLQNQHFALGDRVTMVQDSGSVPLSIKGTVIGLHAKSMDVVWDVAFMSGVTMGDRCSQYRGSSVEFNTCLNLTNPQFVTSTNPTAPPPQRNNAPFNPRFGPHPRVQPAPGQQAAAGFHAAPPQRSTPVHIMANPNRGAGRGAPVSRGVPGRGGLAVAAVVGSVQQQNGAAHTNGRGGSAPSHHAGRGRGQDFGPPRGQFPNFRARGGGFVPRGVPGGGAGRRGIFRGRGRGGATGTPMPAS